MCVLINRLCCQCGTCIEPNPANMCVGCIRTTIDITEGIPKQANLQFCRNCERYKNKIIWYSQFINIGFM